MVQIDAATKKPDRRAEILRRAAAVFREKGFHGAGMREIAEGLGLAPGALYYYFASKEDLLHACQDISLTRLIETAKRITKNDQRADEQLKALIAAHLDLTLDELGGSAAHVEFHALPEDKLAEIVKKRDVYERLIRRLIQRGIQEHVFRDVDPKLTTMALLGALNWSVVWWNPEGRWSSPDLVEGFADVFVDGLRNGQTNGSKRSSR
ncbi:MAG: TetR/AcrR family transcriptional regulator [Planctomycetota bacterium]|nr:TetR/AcrR family transcriptional regulator [Planctomycetota bacterium]